MGGQIKSFINPDESAKGRSENRLLVLMKVQGDVAIYQLLLNGNILPFHIL
jgi:hypothetical protein